MAGEMNVHISTKISSSNKSVGKINHNKLNLQDVSDGWLFRENFSMYNKLIFVIINKELRKIDDKNYPINDKTYNSIWTKIPSLTDTYEDYKRNYYESDDYAYECGFNLQQLFNWFDKYEDEIQMIEYDGTQELRNFMLDLSRLAFKYEVMPNELYIDCDFDFN